MDTISSGPNIYIYIKDYRKELIQWKNEPVNCVTWILNLGGTYYTIGDVLNRYLLSHCLHFVIFQRTICRVPIRFLLDQTLSIVLNKFLLEILNLQPASKWSDIYKHNYVYRLNVTMITVMVLVIRSLSS